MPRGVHTYHFGRLNILGPWSDKKEFLSKALTASIIETRRDFKYSFFDIEELYQEDELFAFGRLVKYKGVLEEEIVDEATHEVVGGIMPEGVVAKSEFFLHYVTGVVAYHPVANRISPKQFREMTARLIEAAYGDFFVDAEIQSVDEEYRLEEAIRKFQVITEVIIDLHPSNPSNREVYRRLDQRLKDLRARRLWEKIVARERGFDLAAFRDDDAYQGLIMAADGYGTGSIQGEIDGTKVTISTEDSPIKKEVCPSEDPFDVLNQLMSVFKRIWKRMAR